MGKTARPPVLQRLFGLRRHSTYLSEAGAQHKSSFSATYDESQTTLDNTTTLNVGQRVASYYILTCSISEGIAIALMAQDCFIKTHTSTDDATPCPCAVWLATLNIIRPSECVKLAPSLALAGVQNDETPSSGFIKPHLWVYGAICHLCSKGQ
ncbi:hypothetical protein M404DRAFT_1005332 [Pisolithus tinctorius Marx 270]|uniref:Uncharacterized protein n=1 Tax=Pisolithus tinctorius Marx 270 TaxID=870435 RepID=A0A0C3NBI5_PISTI|nr:hypothetical protein M404DRAFT_1005332 [Pisolithus tinctorius Marx 270]